MADHHAPAFRCALCGASGTTDVIDSRTAADGAIIRRRRDCHACGERFTTYETAIDPIAVDAAKARARPIAVQLREMAAALELLVSADAAPPALADVTTDPTAAHEASR